MAAIVNLVLASRIDWAGHFSVVDNRTIRMRRLVGAGRAGLPVGSMPGFSGAHSQAESLDEINADLREVAEEKGSGRSGLFSVRSMLHQVG